MRNQKMFPTNCRSAGAAERQNITIPFQLYGQHCLTASECVSDWNVMIIQDTVAQR
jgi:hypothetical protein